MTIFWVATLGTSLVAFLLKVQLDRIGIAKRDDQAKVQIALVDRLTRLKCIVQKGSDRVIEKRHRSLCVHALCSHMRLAHGKIRLLKVVHSNAPTNRTPRNARGVVNAPLPSIHTYSCMALAFAHFCIHPLISVSRIDQDQRPRFEGALAFRTFDLFGLVGRPSSIHQRILFK